jgi:Asp-tRNA(Asn)/Glu-tRNA(Gln) amidotransferase A subunit family amidase
MAVRLVEMHLERIESVDRKGPGLHSIIELNPEALDIAERMDRERRERYRGSDGSTKDVTKDVRGAAQRALGLESNSDLAPEQGFEP